MGNVFEIEIESQYILECIAHITVRITNSPIVLWYIEYDIHALWISHRLLIYEKYGWCFLTDEWTEHDSVRFCGDLVILFNFAASHNTIVTH